MGVGRRTNEGVEKGYREGKDDDARPDDGDHRLYPVPTAVDVRVLIARAWK